MQEFLKEIETAVYDGDEDLVVELTKKALEDGVEPQAIISDAGVPALNQLGEDFNNLIAFLPELMLGGDCMKALIETCTPYMQGADSAFKGKIVIGCAKGNTALRDLLNDTIEKLVSDGTAAQISEKWFGRDIVVFEPLEEE